MNRCRRAVALLLFVLLLLSPCAALAEDEKKDALTVEESVKAANTADQQAQGAPARADAPQEEDLRRRISDTYAAAKKRARRKSFKGYCGAYVANQLVVLGINTSYLSANGNNTFELYRDLNCTSGGYLVSAYRAREYTLEEALLAILREDPSAGDILVGFQRGTSSAGKKYGHVLFIHGIRNGKVYYSDSCARIVDDVKYGEGEPIVCSLGSFVDQFARYKLDGVVHFREPGQTFQNLMTEETASSSAEKLTSEG